jgi:hypothetical protein
MWLSGGDILIQALGGLGVWNALSRKWTRLRTTAWPEIRIDVAGEPRVSGRTVEFSYTYTVAGERYGGAYRNQFRSPVDAERFLRPFDLGASKYVRYSPSNPRKHWLIE